MKRGIWYCAILAAALCVPSRGTDIGRLEPVEAVMVDRQWGQVVIRTDTGDAGRGSTLAQAMQNLRDTTPGTIYLDTADYLLVTRAAGDLLGELSGALRPSARVCRAEGEVDLAAAAEFLSAHAPDDRIKNCRNISELRELQTKSGRMILSERKLKKTEENA